MSSNCFSGLGWGSGNYQLWCSLPILAIFCKLNFLHLEDVIQSYFIYAWTILAKTSRCVYGVWDKLVHLARFAPVGVLLGIQKNFFFPQSVAFPKMCIPWVSDRGCCFYRNRRLFYMQHHGLPLLAVRCFNPRDLPGLCSIGFHWKKKKIKGLKGRFKVVFMRILLWIQNLNLDAPSSLRGDGHCSFGLRWPKATLGVPQPEKCPPAQQHTQGPGIGARVSGSFRTSLCDKIICPIQASVFSKAKWG